MLKDLQKSVLSDPESMGFNMDLVSQNKKLLATQVELLKINKEYTELFDQAPVGYFILDGDGIILKANNSGSKQFEIDKKKLARKPFSLFLKSETCKDKFQIHRNQVLQTGEMQRFECEIKRLDGSTFYALILTTVLKNVKNGTNYFLSMVSDISEQKEQENKIEEALILEKELNEMKSQFITHASHEFRTPLASILLSADLIERYSGPKDEKKEKHFLRIKSSVARLKEILSDFLSLSNIEQGLAVNNPKLFNLVPFIQELIAEIKMGSNTHKIKYLKKEKDLNVSLDRELLRICLTNLLGNAIKYSSDGSAIEISSSKKNTGELSITIKDFGAGIPEKDKPHIFGQFYRAKNVETTQGLGLGLNSTQKIIALMGGSISFESKENEGTTFVLTFPQQ